MSAARAAFLLWGTAATSSPAVASIGDAGLPESSPPTTDASASRPRPLSRRQPGQPPSGASVGISAPHFGQNLSTLVIIGEPLVCSPVYCVKFYQRLRPDHRNNLDTNLTNLHQYQTRISRIYTNVRRLTRGLMNLRDNSSLSLNNSCLQNDSFPFQSIATKIDQQADAKFRGGQIVQYLFDV